MRLFPHDAHPSPILSALRAAAQSEPAAVLFLEQQRWQGCPACPRCGDADVYMMKGRDGQRNADYRWRCKGCKQMFTVRTGTIFEETRLPLRVWVTAFWKACANKKGISALQLSREMEITHKSALFVLRRIRHGLGYDGGPKMTGTVEADETYVGGKPRHLRRKTGRPPAGESNKVPVMAVVQRGGNVRFQALERVTSESIGAVVAANVDLSSRLITDEHAGYQRVGAAMAGGHESVKHSLREYVRTGTDIYSNTVESVFSLLKRGLMGTFHSVSKKHLPNYLNEFEFRHNTRKLSDGERVTRAIRKVDGKRLTYRESVECPPYGPLACPEQANAPF